MSASRTGEAESGMREYAPVSALLRRAAATEEGRMGLMGTLATGDIWRIWRGTEHRTTERDRRTHRIARAELEHRGLLDPAVAPRLQHS
jgi:hypothetical protein